MVLAASTVARDDSWEEIDGGASVVFKTPVKSELKRRLVRVRSLVPQPTKIMVVIKNVHDPVQWAVQLDEADEKGVIHGYGFDCANAALRYRKSGLRSQQRRVLVMYPVSPGKAPLLADADIEAVVPGHWWLRTAVDALRNAKKQLGVHLFVDTGMGRDVLLPDAAPELARAVSQQSRLALRGVMSHLCCTLYESSTARHGDTSPKAFALEVGGVQSLNNWDKPDLTAKQLSRFQQLLKTMKTQKLMPKDAVAHIGSSGTVSQKMHAAMHDMVRVGRLIVDGDTDGQPREVRRAIEDAKLGEEVPLAQRCQALVVTVKTLPKGWCVGYGCEFIYNIQGLGVLQQERKVALLQEQCPDGAAAVNRGLSHTFLQYHGCYVNALLAHGSCGTVVDANISSVLEPSLIAGPAGTEHSGKGLEEGQLLEVSPFLPPQPDSSKCRY